RSSDLVLRNDALPPVLVRGPADGDLPGVRVRSVADVVEERRHLHVAGDRLRHLERADDPTGHVEGAEGVSEAAVLRSGVDEGREAHLPDAPEALERPR